MFVTNRFYIGIMFLIKDLLPQEFICYEMVEWHKHKNVVAFYLQMLEYFVFCASLEWNLEYSEHNFNSNSLNLQEFV